MPTELENNSFIINSFYSYRIRTLLQMQDFYNILLMDPGIPLGSYRSCFALLTSLHPLRAAGGSEGPRPERYASGTE